VRQSARPGTLQSHTPSRFHSRNHGSLAYASSCFWFAAFQSGILSGLLSGSVRRRSNNSISAMVFSGSILFQGLMPGDTPGILSSVLHRSFEIGVHEAIPLDDLSGFQLQRCGEHWPVIDTGMEFSSLAARVYFGQEIT
jgi:hypothetical protein